MAASPPRPLPGPPRSPEQSPAPFVSEAGGFWDGPDPTSLASPTGVSAVSPPCAHGAIQKSWRPFVEFVVLGAVRRVHTPIVHRASDQRCPIHPLVDDRAALIPAIRREENESGPARIPRCRPTDCGCSVTHPRRTSQSPRGTPADRRTANQANSASER